MGLASRTCANVPRPEGHSIPAARQGSEHQPICLLERDRGFLDAAEASGRAGQLAPFLDDETRPGLALPLLDLHLSLLAFRRHVTARAK